MTEISSFSVVADGIKVETGLSSGEVRQSILDRIRAALNVDVPSPCYVRIKTENESFERTFTSPSEIAAADNFLYSLEDEDLALSLWIFPDEMVNFEVEL